MKKSILNAIAAVSAISIVMSVAGMAFAGTVSGDINGDGKVGVTDVVALKSYLIEKEVPEEYSGFDVNDDGKINVTDLIDIKAFAIGYEYDTTTTTVDYTTTHITTTSEVYETKPPVDTATFIELADSSYSASAAVKMQKETTYRKRIVDDSTDPFSYEEIGYEGMNLSPSEYLSDVDNPYDPSSYDCEILCLYDLSSLTANISENTSILEVNLIEPVAIDYAETIPASDNPVTTYPQPQYVQYDEIFSGSSLEELKDTNYINYGFYIIEITARTENPNGEAEEACYWLPVDYFSTVTTTDFTTPLETSITTVYDTTIPAISTQPTMSAPVTTLDEVTTPAEDTSYETSDTTIVTSEPYQPSDTIFTTTTTGLSDYVAMDEITMKISDGFDTVEPEKMLVYKWFYMESSNSIAMADGIPMFESDYIKYVENLPMLQFTTNFKIDTNADKIRDTMKVYTYDTREYVTDITSFDEMSSFENGQYIVQLSAEKTGPYIPNVSSIMVSSDHEYELSYFFIGVNLDEVYVD